MASINTYQLNFHDAALKEMALNRKVISALPSPDQVTLPDTFSHTSSPAPRKQLPSITQILSPDPTPTSPAHDQFQSDEQKGPVNDPQLFPNDESLASKPDNSQPLFDSSSDKDRTADNDRIISSHILAREQQGIIGLQGSREEYALALDFQQCLMKSEVTPSYNRNPAAYKSRELAFLGQYPARYPRNNEQQSKKRKAADTVDKSIKRQRAALKSTIEKLPVPARRATRTSPKERVIDSFDSRVDSPEPAVVQHKHKRKVSATPTVHRDPMAFEGIPDYSPPYNPGTYTRRLKADWKSQPLDISSEALTSQMHEDEVTAASTLRLHADQYLFAKRQIFATCVECLRENKAFNKTAVQKVCKIDVNKASKLHEAFEKSGMFQPKLFEQYL